MHAGFVRAEFVRAEFVRAEFRCLTPEAQQNQPTFTPPSLHQSGT